jgi:3-hydroxy-9,10-secoandrosta-1,3,5(10)-triene-9,17-dione monooxygenase
MDDVALATAKTPDAAALIARARAMVPTLRERAAKAERDRMVPRETIAELRDAGLFRVLQPKRWGGYEMGLEVANEIQMTLAEGCMSTAWVYAVLTVEPFLVAVCDDRMARDVYEKDDSALICGTSGAGPGCTAAMVEGGFRLSGRWRFASGCDHTDWTFLGAQAAAPDGAKVDWRFLLPRADYQIVDTWFVSGLKATGSRDIVVDGAFIPAHRAIKQVDLFLCKGPGQALNTAALYRIPFGQVFALSVSTLLVGGLQGMVDEFLRYAKGRIARGVGPTQMDPAAQLVVAEAQATIDECKLMFAHNIALITGYAERGETASIAERSKYKFHMAYAVERASVLAGRIFKAAGATGVYVENSPLARLFGDINAGRQHVNNLYEAIGRQWGFLMLGGDEKENRDRFL